MNPKNGLFMLPPGGAADPHVNKVRIYEAVISALIIAALSATAAGFVALRVNSDQTERLVKADEKKSEQIVSILTQIAVVQTTLATVVSQQSGIVQQQAIFAREMHDRIVLIEGRVIAGERIGRRLPSP